MTIPNDFYTILANAPLGHAFAKDEVPPEIWQTLGVGEVEGQIGNLHKTFFTKLPLLASGILKKHRLFTCKLVLIRKFYMRPAKQETPTCRFGLVTS